MKVYRVELKFMPLTKYNDSGFYSSVIGPYCTSEEIDSLREHLGIDNYYHLSDVSDYHLSPESDNISREWIYKDSTIYGTKTIELLLKWFSDCLLKLHNSGYHLVVYEVPQEYTYSTDIQTVFDYTKAKVLEFKSLAVVYHKYKKVLA